MNANINEDELRLLTYLHEHATGYTKAHAVRGPEIMKIFVMDQIAFDRASTYLVSHGLLASPEEPDSAAYRTNEVSMSAQISYGFAKDAAKNNLWLTGLGEDYMRELEKQPGMPKRLTVATLKTAGNAALDVATKVLTSLLMIRMAGHL